MESSPLQWEPNVKRGRWDDLNVQVTPEAAGNAAGSNLRLLLNIIGIVTLPAYQMAYNGYKCIKEDPNWETRIYIQGGDIDVETTYPAVEKAMEMSKGNTYTELSEIQGMTFEQRVRFGVNAISGEVNAIETCMRGFDLPSPDDWVAMYDRDKAAGVI